MARSAELAHIIMNWTRWSRQETLLANIRTSCIYRANDGCK